MFFNSFRIFDIIGCLIDRDRIILNKRFSKIIKVSLLLTASVGTHVTSKSIQQPCSEYYLYEVYNILWLMLCERCRFSRVVLDIDMLRGVYNIMSHMSLIQMRTASHRVHKCCLPFAVGSAAAGGLLGTCRRAVAVFANGLAWLELCTHIVKKSLELCVTGMIEYILVFAVLYITSKRKSNAHEILTYLCVMLSSAKNGNSCSVVICMWDSLNSIDAGSQVLKSVNSFYT